LVVGNWSLVIGRWLLEGASYRLIWKNPPNPQDPRSIELALKYQPDTLCLSLTIFPFARKITAAAESV
jgi:hypothetical protein